VFHCLSSGAISVHNLATGQSLITKAVNVTLIGANSAKTRIWFWVETRPLLPMGKISWPSVAPTPAELVPALLYWDICHPAQLIPFAFPELQPPTQSPQPDPLPQSPQPLTNVAASSGGLVYHWAQGSVIQHVPPTKHLICDFASERFASVHLPMTHDQFLVNAATWGDFLFCQIDRRRDQTHTVAETRVHVFRTQSLLAVQQVQISAELSVHTLSGQGLSPLLLRPEGNDSRGPAFLVNCSLFVLQ